MASILRVNTLTDTSSNNSVPIATVASGSAKAIGTIDTDTDNSIDFSFNIASYTDRATGSLYGNFTNNMGSATGYTVLGSPSPVAPGTMNTTNSNRSIICSADTAARFSSNGFSDSDNSKQDLHCHSNAVYGDLA
tara:strand:+ start:306 stop:710 length:405 start_codon:yes stop_codon:yes gene_type:complete